MSSETRNEVATQSLSYASNFVQLLRNHWGMVWLFVFILPALWHPATAGVGGHYEIFYEAGKAAWAGGNPFEKMFTYGSFIYHPSCAFFFYGIFALLPYHVGLIAYICSTFALAFFGIKSFLKILGIEDPLRLNLAFFLSTSELLGTFQNVRIELFILGALLFSASALIRGHIKTSAFLLAVTTVFKIQTAAFAGLLSLLCWKYRSARSWILFYILFGILVFFAPLPITGTDRFFFLLAEQKRMLQFYLTNAYGTHLHFFNFMDGLFGTETRYQDGTLYSLFIAAFFAIFVLIKSRILNWKESIFLCLALACTFMTSFSLMSQSAAYSLSIPLLLVALRDVQNPLVKFGVFGSWFLSSFLYSDLVPRSLRSIIFHSSIKSIGPLLMLAAWLLAKQLSSPQSIRK